MLKVYRLTIEKKTENYEGDILSFLDLYNGQPGYNLYKLATTEGELNSAIGSFVTDGPSYNSNCRQALVVEDNYGNVTGYLMVTRSGFQWGGTRKEHIQFENFIDEHFHGDRYDLSYTEWLENN